LVSPTGRLPSCRAPDGRKPRCPPRREVVRGRVLNIVDGGYAENTGTAQVAELMPQLERLVAAYNGATRPAAPSTPPPAQVRLVLVEVENREPAGEKAAALGTGASEAVRPVEPVLNVAARRTG